jgi:hypothetical protein
MEPSKERTTQKPSVLERVRSSNIRPWESHSASNRQKSYASYYHSSNVAFCDRLKYGSIQHHEALCNILRMITIRNRHIFYTKRPWKAWQANRGGPSRNDLWSYSGVLSGEAKDLDVIEDAYLMAAHMVRCACVLHISGDKVKAPMLSFLEQTVAIMVCPTVSDLIEFVQMLLG